MQWVVYDKDGDGSAKRFRDAFGSMTPELQKRLAELMVRAEQDGWLEDPNNSRVKRLVGDVAQGLLQLGINRSGSAPRLVFDRIDGVAVAYVPFQKRVNSDNLKAARLAIAQRNEISVKGLANCTIPLRVFPSAVGVEVVTGESARLKAAKDQLVESPDLIEGPEQKIGRRFSRPAAQPRLVDSAPIIVNGDELLAASRTLRNLTQEWQEHRGRLTLLRSQLARAQAEHEEAVADAELSGMSDGNIRENVVRDLTRQHPDLSRTMKAFHLFRFTVSKALGADWRPASERLTLITDRIRSEIQADLKRADSGVRSSRTNIAKMRVAIEKVEQSFVVSAKNVSGQVQSMKLPAFDRAFGSVRPNYESLASQISLIAAFHEENKIPYDGLLLGENTRLPGFNEARSATLDIQQSLGIASGTGLSASAAKAVGVRGL